MVVPMTPPSRPVLGKNADARGELAQADRAYDRMSIVVVADTDQLCQPPRSDSGRQSEADVEPP